jgi:uncharacterized membrane protein YfcA
VAVLPAFPSPARASEVIISSFLALLPDQSPSAWVLVLIAALVVGLSKAALPGAGTIAAGLFALALPAKESTAALLLLLILGDATALWMYRREPDKKTLVRLIPSVLVGLVLGAFFLALADGDAVRRGIGVILLALVGVTVCRRWRASRAPLVTAQAADGGASSTADGGVDDDADGGDAGATADAAAGGHRAGRLPRLVYGALGGFTTMVANAGGPVMSMYFLAMKMPVLTFLGTSAWFFATVNILKVPFSASLGLFHTEYLLMDLLLAPLVILAAWCGRLIAQRIPQKVFEVVVLVLTAVSAAALVI